MKFFVRNFAFFAILGGLAACSALPPGNTSDASSAPPRRASAFPAPSPSTASESVASSSAPGYVDPAVAAQLAAKCQVVGVIGDYFVIPEASSFQSIFPAAGLTPELDGLQGLFVAVYDGDVQVLNYTGGRPAPSATFQNTFQNVVCVVAPNGEVDIYPNVSRQNVALPSGAHVGSPPTIAP